jgi:TetR/AcrR family transcriptional regulator, regulator of autoinduction and epiphytic fitness
VSSPPSESTRSYVSSLRARQAQQTRTDILAAAVQLFARNGWAKTTLAAVAGEAGVAVETVYKSFRSKKALLQAAMDVAIVGDTEPLALLDREAFIRLADEPPAERFRDGVAVVAATFSGPVTRVWAAMQEAAAGDPEVAHWCTEHEERRRQTIAQWLKPIYRRDLDDHTLDILWVLSSLEGYTKLTTERGWTTDQWADWLVKQYELTLGPPPAAAP